MVAKTQATHRTIGQRRKPQPGGQPGDVRVDTVHQGDQDGAKGVYHVNAVDEVTQFQLVGTVEAISERFLLPVLEGLIEAFPFVIQDIHADNGSESALSVPSCGTVNQPSHTPLPDSAAAEVTARQAASRRLSGWSITVIVGRCPGERSAQRGTLLWSRGTARGGYPYRPEGRCGRRLVRSSRTLEGRWRT